MSHRIYTYVCSCTCRYTRHIGIVTYCALKNEKKSLPGQPHPYMCIAVVLLLFGNMPCSTTLSLLFSIRLTYGKRKTCKNKTREAKKKLATTRHATLIIITIITIIFAAERITSVSRVFATHHELDRYTASAPFLSYVQFSLPGCAPKLYLGVCVVCAFIYVKSMEVCKNNWNLFVFVLWNSEHIPEKTLNWRIGRVYETIRCRNLQNKKRKKTKKTIETTAKFDETHLGATRWNDVIKENLNGLIKSFRRRTIKKSKKKHRHHSSIYIMAPQHKHILEHVRNLIHTA